MTAFGNVLCYSSYSLSILKRQGSMALEYINLAPSMIFVLRFWGFSSSSVHKPMCSPSGILIGILYLIDSKAFIYFCSFFISVKLGCAL